MERLDVIFKAVATGAGGIIGYLYGGWSTLLGILLAFVIIDYITGLIAAGTEGKLNSSVGFKGIAKKVLIFVVVAVGHLVDQALGGDNHIFRDGVIFFYMANEILSILENIGRAGLPVWEPLRNAVEVLRNKGEKK